MSLGEEADFDFGPTYGVNSAYLIKSLPEDGDFSPRQERFEVITCVQSGIIQLLVYTESRPIQSAHKLRA